MKIEKLEQVMLNFDEPYIDSLLDDLKESLAEWSFGDNKLVTKKNKVEIIISINGVSLFNDEEFRRRFFSSTEDKAFIRKVSSLISYLPNHGCPFDQNEFANKAKRIEFGERDPYTYIVREYFGLADYQFDRRVDDTSMDIIERSGKEFFELYDYQYMIKQQVINDLSNPDKDLYKILIHMPTGTGKTKTTMHIIAHYINFVSKGKGCVVWIAHTNELLKQAYDTFCQVWGHLGLKPIEVYKGWVEFPEEIKEGILFTSIQTLQAKMRKPIFAQIGEMSSLIIFDEVHKAGAPKTKECISLLTKKDNAYGKKFIGLTATPGRTTDLSRENDLFVKEFDHIVGIDVDLINTISLSPSEARNYQGSKDPIRFFQENQYLSFIDKEILDFHVDEATKAEIARELRNSSETFSSDLVNRIAMNKARNLKIVERLRSLNEQGTPTIVFACSLAHAKMLSAFLKLIEIDNSLVYGDMDSYSRAKAIDDFKKGRVNIIINYEILTTGFDSTNIRCVFITRPTKSVILYSQMIGRGLRGPRMGGNPRCTLIDVEENILSFNENKAFKHFDKYWDKE